MSIDGNRAKLEETSTEISGAGLSGSKLFLSLHYEQRREPLVARIAEWVARGIIEGRIRPGQELSSVDLAGQFSTSRTPVREALMLLEQEGLVEMRARRRPIVAAPTISEVRDVYQVRRQLLSLAARLVAERIDDTELGDIKRRVLLMRVSANEGDVESYFWQHVDYQDSLLEIAGNSVMKQILDSLSLQTLVLRHRSIAQPGRLVESITEQESMLRAYESRDPDLASLLMANSTSNALRAIENSESSDG